MTEGNAINLASLWIPVMPETSHLDGKLREAGERGRKAYEEGFGSGGGAEALGASFADKFAASFGSRLRNANLGLGVGNMVGQLDKLHAQVDEKLATKLKSQMPAAYKAVTVAQEEYRASLQRAQPVMDREAELTQKLSVLKQQHAEVNKQAVTASVAHQEALKASNYTLSENSEITQRAYAVNNKEHALRVEMINTERELTNAHERSTQAKRDLIPVQQKVNQEQERYTGLTERHAQASAHAFNMSSMFSGMLGGAMVLGIQAVVSGLEHLIQLGAHVFEDAIKGAAELGEKLVEIGEDYQQLNIQVESYSSASGDALTQFQDHAAKVFAGLDVAGKDTGKTMAQLGSTLGIGAGKALDDLTHNVEELQGRFSGLKSGDVGSIFHVFKTGADDLNSSLATLLKAGQDSGQGLAAITDAMSGDAAVTLKTAGFSLGQVAHFAGELGKAGLPAKSVMMGLNASMKVFGKEGLDFRGGITEAIKELSALGNTAAGDALAEKLFGGRRWTEVMQMVPAFKELISSTADSFDAPESALHEFLDDTETIAEKIEKFKHKIEDAFKPFGESAKGAVEHGLKSVSEWFDQNHDAILTKINQWGDAFIDDLPKIRDFVTGGIALLGAFAKVFREVAEIGAMFASMWEIVTGNKDESDKIDRFAKQLDDIDIDKVVKGAQNQVTHAFDGIISKSDDLKNALGDLTDSAKNMPSYTGSFTPPPYAIPKGLPPSGPGPSGPEFTWSTPDHKPNMSNNAPGGGAPGSHPLPVNPFTGPPGGSSTTPGQLPSIAPQDTPSGYSGGYPGGVNWPAIAQAESSGNWTIDHGEGFDVTGAFQISTPTWLSHGGGQYAPKAFMAPPEAQLAVAEAILADPSQGPTAWPQTYRNHPEWFGSYAKTQGVQTGGFTRGFDTGGNGDGRSWTDHAIDAGKFLGDDALSWGALMGRGALSGAGTIGKLAAKVAGPLGIALPFVVEAISPSAHASTSDTTPFNPGKRAPGRETGGGVNDKTSDAWRHKMGIGQPRAPFKHPGGINWSSGLGPIEWIVNAIQGGYQTGGGPGDDPNNKTSDAWRHKMGIGQPRAPFKHPGGINWSSGLGPIEWIVNAIQGGYETGGMPSGNVTNSGDQGIGGSGSSVFPDWWQKIIDSPNDVVPGWMIPGFDLDPRIQRGIGGGGNRPDPWNIMPNAPGRETGGRGPKDTLPVWVTPNEYIWNDEAVSKYGWLIHPLNEEAQGRGTGVSTMFRNAKGFVDGGSPGGFDNQLQGVDPQVSAITPIANQFGLTLTSGFRDPGGPAIAGVSAASSLHGSGQAGDFGNGDKTNEELQFAAYMYQHFGSEIAELIHDDPRWQHNILNGKDVGAMDSSVPGAYHTAQAGYHGDHVHVGIRATTELYDQMSMGSQPLALPGAGGAGGGGFSASPAGWGGGGGFGAPGGPGMPGGPGFPTDPSQMTPQQFQLWDEQRGRDNAIRGKNDRIQDLTKEKEHLEKVEIPKATKERDDEKNLPPLAQTPGKLESLQDALDRLTERLTKITGRELPEAQEDLQADLYKARQPLKARGGKDEGGDAAKDFGSKFLGGIAQSLGFPDVFGGKAPWDFGIVKALGRFTTGFMSGMQQEQQGGGGPGYGGGGMPGMPGIGGGSFLDGLSGLKLPTNAFQGGVPPIAGGPNTFATGPTPHMPGGPGPDAPSGPSAGAIHIGNQDNSINVYPATDRDTKSSLQSYKNSYNAAQPIAAAPSFSDIPASA